MRNVMSKNCHECKRSTARFHAHDHTVFFPILCLCLSWFQNVRVWDLQDCACLQNIHSRNVTMSRFPISSVHYNRDTNTLVLATFLVCSPPCSFTYCRTHKRGLIDVIKALGRLSSHKYVTATLASTAMLFFAYYNSNLCADRGSTWSGG